MDTWIKESLGKCLDFEVPDEMVEYILKIKEENSLRIHFDTLLDFTNETHCLFYNSLKLKLFPSKHVSQIASSKTSNRKNDDEEDRKTGAKRKTKFYNFYGKDGQTNDIVLLKGRNRCDCQAGKHKLVNNCLNCGRIVCEQEGSGLCMCCGNLVCSEEEMKLINSQTKKGENLKKSLMESKKSKGLDEAMATRDRLLEYDKHSERRTTVIDDESDYFKSNSVWLNDDERKKLVSLEDQLRDQKHASRLKTKVTLDFSGRQIVDEPLLTKEIEDKILQQIIEATSSSNHFSNVGNPALAGQAPIFDPSLKSQFPKLKSSTGFDGIFNRVQDKEFQEMSDQRCAMSMHQPYASLLVAGIKMHEGRSWYTAHRGRLWIASTAKSADLEEIKQLENFYKIHYNQKTFNFPSQYPSGVLLGCVNVTECLPQEEYRKIYPDGESDSPFVFICTEPQELSVRFPVKGEHKIYKLDQNIHSAANKTLLKLQPKAA